MLRHEMANITHSARVVFKGCAAQSVAETSFREGGSRSLMVPGDEAGDKPPHLSRRIGTASPPGEAGSCFASRCRAPKRTAGLSPGRGCGLLCGNAPKRLSTSPRGEVDRLLTGGRGVSSRRRQLCRSEEPATAEPPAWLEDHYLNTRSGNTSTDARVGNRDLMGRLMAIVNPQGA